MTTARTAAAVALPDAFAGPWSDFPGTPIIDPNGTAPTGHAQTLFGDPIDAVPRPAARACSSPRSARCIRATGSGRASRGSRRAGENLFELRITTPTQVNPLVVYTTATQWTMPADLWTGLQTHSVEHAAHRFDPRRRVRRHDADDGSRTARAATSRSHRSMHPARSCTGRRPAALACAASRSATRPSRTSSRRPTRGSQCVGCHSSTPDGNFVGFSSSQNPGNGDPTTLGLLSSDGTHTAPPFITPSARR